MQHAGSDRRTHRRVVVTGLGVVSPIGVGVSEFWRSALAGTIGTGEISLFDTRGFLTHRGGEVKNFASELYIKGAHGELSRSAQFAVAAARMALEDSGLAASCRDSERVGVCFGMVVGNRPSFEPLLRTLFESRGTESVFPVTSCHDATIISRAPAAEFALRGPNVAIPTACAAGNSAIGYASDLIKAGRADAMIAGGADELSESMFCMFNSFRALAPELVQPFDRKRKGLMLSEGAGTVLLESLEHASRRGAVIYGEVLGHGNFADGYHMTAPHPDGSGAIRSMRRAIEMAGVSSEEVDYINAHGTGTPANDVVEARAIRAVFGPATDKVPVSSIKGMLGHAQGAASAIEAVACVLALRDGVIPPNVNLEERDPDCNLAIVANEPREQQVRVVLNNAFGFGGNISCVVFGNLR